MLYFFLSCFFNKFIINKCSKNILDFLRKIVSGAMWVWKWAEPRCKHWYVHLVNHSGEKSFFNQEVCKGINTQNIDINVRFCKYRWRHQTSYNKWTWPRRGRTRGSRELWVLLYCFQHSDILQFLKTIFRSSSRPKGISPSTTSTTNTQVSRSEYSTVRQHKISIQKIELLRFTRVFI